MSLKSLKKEKKEKKSEEKLDSKITNSSISVLAIEEIEKIEEIEENEDEEDEEDEEDLSPRWKVLIDGLLEMEASTFKFSVFTPGEVTSGQIVVEFVTKQKVNSSLIGWLTKPVERKLRVEINDHNDEYLERWEMMSLPVAIVVDELDVESENKLHTTIQMSVKGISVT